MARRKANCEKIKEAIELSGGMTTLANRIDVVYDTVVQWKHGRRSPNIEHALAIEEITEGKIRAKDILPDYPWARLEKAN